MASKTSLIKNVHIFILFLNTIGCIYKCVQNINVHTNGVFNLRQHFEILYSRYANKHYITCVYIAINDIYR